MATTLATVLPSVQSQRLDFSSGKKTFPAAVTGQWKPLGYSPRQESTSGGPLDRLAAGLSLNLHRRHLSTSQKATVAARAREIYDRAAKERQKRKPANSVVENLPQQNEKARDAAGKALGISGKSVDFATKVINQGTPELQAAVDRGEVKISTAAKLADAPKEVQTAAVAGGKQAIEARSGEVRSAACQGAGSEHNDCGEGAIGGREER